MNASGLSVIIPAKNEERYLDATLHCVREAADNLKDLPCEIRVVDNNSEDQTQQIARSHPGVHVSMCTLPGAGAARNEGVRLTQGELLVFVDADTLIPPDSLLRIYELSQQYDVGMFDLRGMESSLLAKIWWLHFSWVRMLPVATVKAMSAFMFCKRSLFERLGGFSEQICLGEEWAILAEGYRRNRHAFTYDRSIYARTSGRRMEQQRFGYFKTYCQYLAALCYPPSRTVYSDQYR